MIYGYSIIDINGSDLCADFDTLEAAKEYIATLVAEDPDLWLPLDLQPYEYEAELREDLED